MKNKLNALACKFLTKKATTKEKISEVMCTPMKGATAMEYVLIVSIMALVIIASWKLVAGKINDRMNQVANDIGNKGDYTPKHK